MGVMSGATGFGVPLWKSDCQRSEIILQIMSLVKGYLSISVESMKIRVANTSHAFRDSSRDRRNCGKTQFCRLGVKTLLHSMAVIAALKHCAAQNRSFSASLRSSVHPTTRQTVR